jgi:FkbM family methyltransferase
LISATDILCANMLQTAAYFDLSSKVDRIRSVTTLEKLFFRICKESQPSIFIEAGALDAKTSVGARKILPDSRIVAFEANPKNYADFSPNPALKKSRVEYLHVALSDKAGELTFYQPTKSSQPVDSGQGSILPRADSGQTVKATVVVANRLDKLVTAKADSSIAMWIDVEGALKEVLAGARDLLPLSSAIFVEVEARHLWQNQWLAKDVVEHFAEFGLIPIARDFQSRYQYNILFLSAKMLHDPRTQLFVAEFHSNLGLHMAQKLKAVGAA